MDRVDQQDLTLDPVSWLHTIHCMALRYHKKSCGRVEIADLYSAGVLRLMKCLNNKELDLGRDFRRFIMKSLKFEMIDELRRQSAMPEATVKRYYELLRARRDASEELGHEATDLEVANYLKIPVQKFQKEWKSVKPAEFVYLDQVMDNRSVENIRDESSPDPFGLAAKNSRLEFLMEEVSKLKPRDRKILLLRVIEGETLLDIGAKFQLSKERVRQIVFNIQKKLYNKVRFDSNNGKIKKRCY